MLIKRFLCAIAARAPSNRVSLYTCSCVFETLFASFELNECKKIR